MKIAYVTVAILLVGILFAVTSIVHGTTHFLNPSFNSIGCTILVENF